MGIEIAAAALVLGAISTFGSIASNASASADRQRSYDAQVKANNVTINQQRNNSSYERRARIREERVRRASMMQGAENSGTSGSSALYGGVSSLGSNFSAMSSQERGQTVANEGLNKLNQTSAQYDQNARETLAWNDVFQNTVKTGQNIFNL